MENCTLINECLACGSFESLRQILDLGNQPLANNFRKSAELQEVRYPLAVNRCSECNHLQLTHAVNPKIIYENYLYVSGTSRTYVEYMDWYARFVREYFTHGDYVNTVLDIGCNDGSQLNAFSKFKCDTYGVDPAENLYPISRLHHTVVQGFWDKEIAKQFNQKFDVITSQNAFSHIPDPLAYLELAGKYLTSYGKIFISTSQADMVLNGEFDTIYHEHISYYTAASMKALAERAGLFLIDVVKTPIHGTSYIFVLSRTPMNVNRVENILAMESIAGLDKTVTYLKWARGVDRLLVGIREEIQKFQSWGYHTIGYGAAAKGMTLLNTSQIILDAVIDDNPLKQGTWCPGTNIPVVGIDYLNRIPSTEHILFIPLAWNFYSEIKGRIQAVRNNEEDIFMKYFPNIKIDKNEYRTSY